MKWYTLTNKEDATLQIDLMDEIGGWGVSSQSFVNQLRLVSSAAKNIVLNIDSPGGSCDDGFTMHDALKATNLPVTANIIGMAASMASVVMLAAKTITIAENGRVMIHRVSGGAMGNPDDLDAAAARIRQYEDRIVSLYVARTGKPETAIRDMMKADMGTWLFGQDAVDAGFADSVTKGVKAKAFNLGWVKHFQALPSALFDTPPRSDTPSATTPPSSTTMTEAEEQAAAGKKAAEEKAAKEAAEKAAAEAKAKDEKIAALAKRLEDMEAAAKTAEEAKAKADADAKAAAEAKAKDDKIADLAARLEKMEAAAKAGLFGKTQAGAKVDAGNEGDSKESPRDKALAHLTEKNKKLSEG